jgi:hypothetical protein
LSELKKAVVNSARKIRTASDHEKAPWLSVIVLGSLVPLAFLGYGLRCIMTMSGIFVGRHGPMRLSGYDAIVLGISCIAVALTFHSRFIWSELFGTWFIARIAQMMGVVAWLCCMICLAVRVLFDSFAV